MNEQITSVETVEGFSSNVQQNLINEKPKSRLEKASFIIFLISIIFSPLVFVFSAYVGFDMIKTAVIVLGVLLSSILYFISLLKNKSFYIPKHPLIGLSFGIILSIIISSFISSNIWKSFFGQAFEIGAGSFILILFLTSLLTIYLTFKDKDKILYVYGAIILPFFLLALFHIIRFFSESDFLDFGIFQSATSTMLGKWNDIAVYSGIIAILSYTGLQFISLNKSFRILLTVSLILSGLFLFIVNSSIIWSCMALIIVLLGVFQYLSVPREGRLLASVWKRLPIFTIIIFLISVLFAWKGNIIASPVIKYLKVENTEISLPWQFSVDVISGTIKESPLFGAGPNRFSNQYLKYKPQIINSTPFWNVEFSNAFGFIPTFIVTQGLVGGILWIVFIIVLIFSGFKALKKATDPFSLFFIGSTFFSSLFLWIISLVYVPSHPILFLTFILTGLFAGVFIDKQYILVNKKIITIPSTILIAICAIWLFVYANKAIALTYFQSAIDSLNLPQNQGLEKAERDFKKALSYSKNDIYYQALSEVNILKTISLLQNTKTETGKVPDPNIVSEVGRLIEEAIQYTRDAIKIDPTNYYNYIAQARILELALSLRIQNAYENTKIAYTNAISYNPYNPLIYLNLARLEVSQNKPTEAERFIGQSLQLKQNYIDAIFLLSQIQVSQGKIRDAIISVEVAIVINPTNPLLFFQLGLLYYNDKNYQKAVDALSQAIKLDNQYANAKYFLGLSYARLGEDNDAIIQFENLKETNPDNNEISLILSNLKSGKSPFADAKPPIDNKPEQRKSLPVRQ